VGTRLLVILVVVFIALPIMSFVAYEQRTGIDSVLRVELVVPYSYSEDGEFHDFVIVDRNGFFGGRVGSRNGTTNSETFLAMFDINRTGEYEVTGGVRAGAGSVMRSESIEFTLDDDGRSLSVRIDLGSW
jgi:hypothetical protein